MSITSIAAAVTMGATTCLYLQDTGTTHYFILSEDSSHHHCNILVAQNGNNLTLSMLETRYLAQKHFFSPESLVLSYLTMSSLVLLVTLCHGGIKQNKTFIYILKTSAWKGLSISWNLARSNSDES
jgi:hypothetical protein